MLTLIADGRHQSVGACLGSKWAAFGWGVCVNIDGRCAASGSRCMSG